MKNIHKSTLKFLKSPSDARQLTMVGMVAVGVLACFGSLIPRPYRGQTAQELSDIVRQDTKELVEWTNVPLTNPETDAAKIEAQWQKVTGNIDDNNATLIASHAREAFNGRTWPVATYWGKVNGKGAWVVLGIGETRLAKASGIQMVCYNGLAGEDGVYGRGGPRITPTEIAVIDSAKPFNLLYHEDR